MNFWRDLNGCVKGTLKRGAHVHIRERRIGSVSDLIDLIDRFVEGKLDYELEWDDFISWKSDNQYIESIRDEIGSHEGLLFSKSRSDRELYCLKIMEIRNKMAALINVPQR